MCEFFSNFIQKKRRGYCYRLRPSVRLYSRMDPFFCDFSMGRNQYWAGRVYDLCVYYMTGTPEGSTESGFMEKPGIEPATPGLQGIALIHYTTGASHG